MGRKGGFRLKMSRLPNLYYWCGKMHHDNKSCELWIQSKGMLQVFEQQFGPSLRASPYRLVGKVVVVVPEIFEKSPPQHAWSDKDDADMSRSNSDTAAPTERVNMVIERIETTHDRLKKCMRTLH